ncbi:MAG TPA: hypothetical protein VN317_08655 [Candidatus Methanoperedens sp.]|nr:hypothetical protein [Candidatus Methanoperedens sp.]
MHLPPRGHETGPEPVDTEGGVRYLHPVMDDSRRRARDGGARSAVRAALALFPLFVPGLAGAAVVAEGTYTISAPEQRSIPFRMVLTPTGARIVPRDGETLVFSYEQKSALVLDRPSRSYFLLPLELVTPLLSAGLGYDPRGLGATVSGAAKTLLGQPCNEVVVSGRSPRFTLRSWRVADSGWSRDYARLERALALPWATADPPAIFVGLPLAGSVEIEGSRPYRAAWQITRLERDDRAGEDFSVPGGYRMDLERLLSAQGRR